jgi:hypothetical protein
VGPRLPVTVAAFLFALPALAGAGGLRLEPRLLADFDHPVAGPAVQAFARAPSTAALRHVPDEDGQALELSGRQAQGGLAGLRIRFRDDHQRPTTIDGSRYDYLTFRMRATGRPSRVQLRIADSADAKDEAMDAGEITRYLPQGLSGEWQQVSVPLGALGLKLKAFAGLALIVLDPVDFTFFVDDLALKRDPEDSLPPPRRRAGVP